MPDQTDKRNVLKNSILKVIWNSVFNITGLDVSYSARYYDWSFYMIQLRADYQLIKKLLSEKHLIPKETAPGETNLQIVGCEMRKVQVAGPYNEVSIQVPVEPLDETENEKFTHLYLPVNTRESEWPGVNIYGFPKFIANIDIITSNNRIICRLAEGNQMILEFKMDDKAGPRKHIKWDFYGIRKQEIVKTTMDLEGFISEEESNGNASLVLGKHGISGTLRKILLSDKVERTMTGHDISSILKKPVRISTN